MFSVGYFWCDDGSCCELIGGENYGVFFCGDNRLRVVVIEIF